MLRYGLQMHSTVLEAALLGKSDAVAYHSFFTRQKWRAEHHNGRDNQL